MQFARSDAIQITSQKRRVNLVKRSSKEPLLFYVSKY